MAHLLCLEVNCLFRRGRDCSFQEIRIEVVAKEQEVGSWIFVVLSSTGSYSMLSDTQFLSIANDHKRLCTE